MQPKLSPFEWPCFPSPLFAYREHPMDHRSPGHQCSPALRNHRLRLSLWQQCRGLLCRCVPLRCGPHHHCADATQEVPLRRPLLVRFRTSKCLAGLHLVQCIPPFFFNKSFWRNSKQKPAILKRSTKSFILSLSPPPEAPISMK